MSYSVINQDGVHLCDIPLNVYQVIRRQSLSALWLYWAQSLNLVKVLIACVKDDLCDAGNVVLGAGGVPLG
ncbi:hypothetical protein [Enterobacter hormaechei]|uniref:hypothetical protein n=1 Tax=Enterobacter hormaechei TaxID=158836 RepID=UPI00254A38DB|nr:hypothetical protein [Enterobacter hormaechei]MEC6096343.1 hypothetical protein [Enterobacter hormaechei]